MTFTAPLPGQAPHPDTTRGNPMHTVLVRAFTWLLLLATVMSVLSALAFMVYLLAPWLLGSRARVGVAPLYTLGTLGLAVAFGCQVLGIIDLIVQWLLGHKSEKKPREIVILVLSLIPYMLVLILLLTLIAYARARRRDRDSPRTAEAALELKEQVVDAVIDAGSNTTSSMAAAPGTASAAPSAAGSVRTARSPVPVRPGSASSARQVAVQRVVGPIAAQQVAHVPSALVVLVAAAVLVPTVGAAPLAAAATRIQRQSAPAPHTALAGPVVAPTASPTRQPPINCPSAFQSQYSATMPVSMLVGATKPFPLPPLTRIGPFTPSQPGSNNGLIVLCSGGTEASVVRFAQTIPEQQGWSTTSPGAGGPSGCPGGPGTTFVCLSDGSGNVVVAVGQDAGAGIANSAIASWQQSNPGPVYWTITV